MLPLLSPSASSDHFTSSGRELGRLRSVVELDGPSVTAEQVAAIEQSVNEKIRDGLPVNVQEMSLDDPEVEKVRGEPGGRLLQKGPQGASQPFSSPVFQVRGRGLPDDHAGPIRVVTIHSVDSNMCCGTHVSNLSDLQVGEEGLEWLGQQVSAVVEGND